MRQVGRRGRRVTRQTAAHGRTVRQLPERDLPHGDDGAAPAVHHRPEPARGRRPRGARPAGVRLRGRQRRQHVDRPGQPRRLRAVAHRAPHAARRQRARPVDHRAGRGDAGARSCWRRSACRRSSTPTASWPRRGPRRPSGWCSSTPRPRPTRSSRWPRRRATASAGTSSTGRTSAPWPRRSSGRAEAAGYTALVVTLDTFVMGWRPTDLDTAYLPFLQGVGIANYLTDPAFTAPLGRRRRRSSTRSSAGPASSATRR